MEKLEYERIAKKEIGIDQVIALMDIYLSEWCYRDEVLWSQVYKHFYAVLVVIILPNIASVLNVDIPPLPTFVFRVAGLFMALVFLYVSIGYLKRLDASGKTYQKIINALPLEYQRVSISQKQTKMGKLFNSKISTAICSCMFIALIALSSVLLIVG